MSRPISTVLIACLLLPSTAFGQTPEGVRKTTSASSGTTDVATQGFEAPAAKPEDETDATTLQISAGGLVASGNTRSLALTSASNFRLRRGMNQVTSSLAANIASAAPSRDEGVKRTAQNVQGKLRYDRFLTNHLALFLGSSARHDPFQELDLRLNIDPGVAYYLIDEEKQLLWGEGGYDLQHDVRTSDSVDPAADPPIEKTATRHSVRLFGGYENKINEAVAFSTGAEYIQSFQESKNWRFNYDASLTSAIGGGFAAATTFVVRYDNNPLPGVSTTDLVTSFSLVVTLL